MAPLTCAGWPTLSGAEAAHTTLVRQCQPSFLGNGPVSLSPMPGVSRCNRRPASANTLRPDDADVPIDRDGRAEWL
jgi:hypothetical protein